MAVVGAELRSTECEMTDFGGGIRSGDGEVKSTKSTTFEVETVGFGGGTTSTTLEVGMVTPLVLSGDGDELQPDNCLKLRVPGVHDGLPGVHDVLV